MRYLFLFFSLILCPGLGTSIISAQNAADICTDDNTAILNSVTDQCRHVGANEACYGNREVNITTSGDVNVRFDEPGALVNIASIRSIFLSEINETENTWGVAQIRMLVNQGNGVQEVTMLLFGDVAVNNSAVDIQGVQTTVKTEAQVFPTAPQRGFQPTYTLPAGTIVEAVGRLQDSQVWVQIRVPDTGDNGWVFRNLLNIHASAFGTLEVKDGTEPLFGSMQAFTFESGTSSCENAVVDGMIIQTPEGMARVSFLINEVTIELTGAGDGASAFVEANPESGAMNISVLDGTAYVTTASTTQQVRAGSQTSVEIDENLNPSGPPESARPFNQETVNSIPVLPMVRDTDQPYEPPDNSQPPRSEAIENGDSNLFVTSSTSNNGGTTNNTTSNNNNDSGQGNSDTQNNDGGSNTGGTGNTDDNNPTPENGNNTTNNGSDGSGGSGNENSNTNNSNGDESETTLTGHENSNSNSNNNDTVTHTTETEAEDVWLRIYLFGGLLVIGIIFVSLIVIYMRRTHK